MCANTVPTPEAAIAAHAQRRGKLDETHTTNGSPPTASTW